MCIWLRSVKNSKAENNWHLLSIQSLLKQYNNNTTDFSSSSSLIFDWLIDWLSNILFANLVTIMCTMYSIFYSISLKSIKKVDKSFQFII